MIVVFKIDNFYKQDINIKIMIRNIDDNFSSPLVLRQMEEDGWRYFFRVSYADLDLYGKEEMRRVYDPNDDRIVVEYKAGNLFGSG